MLVIRGGVRLTIMSTDATAIVDSLLVLLSTSGQAEYHGEKVSQLEHALQTADLARREGGSEEEVLAALLHDIGHVWPDGDGEREVTNVGVVHHASVGAAALRKMGFSEAVASIAAGHVNAKRYLVGQDAEYAGKLSECSVESLRRQGGPMGAEEAAEFARGLWFEEKIRLRKRDDRAKIPGASVPGLDSYRDIIIAHLSRQQDCK
jgi:putative nucleotidyltransferase with HDIG domain